MKNIYKIPLTLVTLYFIGIGIVSIYFLYLGGHIVWWHPELPFTSEYVSETKLWYPTAQSLLLVTFLILLWKKKAVSTETDKENSGILPEAKNLKGCHNSPNKETK